MNIVLPSHQAQYSFTDRNQYKIIIKYSKWSFYYPLTSQAAISLREKISYWTTVYLLRIPDTTFRFHLVGLDFCKERGFSELVLQTSANRTAAVNLYQKLGFHVVMSEYKSQLCFWIIRLANDPVVTMKKYLYSCKKCFHL